MAIKVEITDRGLIQSKTDVPGPTTFEVNGFVPGGVMPIREIDGALTITSLEYYGQTVNYYTRNYQINTSDIGKCLKLKVTDIPEEYGGEYGEYPGLRGDPQLILPVGPDCPVGSCIRLVCGTGVESLDSALSLQGINTNSVLSYFFRNSGNEVNLVQDYPILTVGTMIDLFKVAKFSEPIGSGSIGYDEYGVYDGEGPYDEYGVDSRLMVDYSFWKTTSVNTGGY